MPPSPLVKQLEPQPPIEEVAILNDEAVNDAKYKLFNEIQAVEWMLKHREPSTRETYEAKLNSLYKTMEEQGIPKAAYEAFLEEEAEAA